MRKPTRDHDAAIAALRKRALQIVKNTEDGGDDIAHLGRITAASYNDAADYLASITGKIERARRTTRRSGR